MTDEQVQAIWDVAKKKVTVSCCEYHAHSAVKGCLDGNDENAVSICQLAETLLSERARIRAVVESLGAP